MSRIKTVATLGSAVGLVLLASCENGDHIRAATLKSTKTITWLGRGGGFKEWGQTYNGVFGLSYEPQILEAWQWESGMLTRTLSVEVPPLLRVAILPEDRYLACTEGKNDYENWPLVLALGASNKVIKRWPTPERWKFCRNGISSNGHHVVVVMDGDPGDPPAGYDILEGVAQIGVLNLSTMEIRWLAKLTTKGNGFIEKVVISDDGKYIALGGWDNSNVVIDTSDGKVLWKGRPPNCVTPQFPQFSPDGKRLYAGDGGSGCVYCYETTTGKLRNRWYTSSTGDAFKGPRVTCIAVSPDGAWIAAGTGPQGCVFLFDAKTAAQPILLPHGLTSTLEVSFSPDSRHLASVAGGLIKIWDLPARGPNAAAVTQPSDGKLGVEQTHPAQATTKASETQSGR